MSFTLQRTVSDEIMFVLNRPNSWLPEAGALPVRSVGESLVTAVLSVEEAKIRLILGKIPVLRMQDEFDFF